MTSQVLTITNNAIILLAMYQNVKIISSNTYKAIILIAMYHFQIDLSDNMLSSLPTGSINIPTLTSLNLAYNKLVRIITIITNTIVIITNMPSSLNLAYNKLVGSNITKVTITVTTVCVITVTLLIRLLLLYKLLKIRLWLRS